MPPTRSAPAHPLDPVIEALSGLSVAVRAANEEMREGFRVMSARIDGQSRATQSLAKDVQKLEKEVRAFGSSGERLMGRVAALELLEGARLATTVVDVAGE